MASTTHSMNGRRRGVLACRYIAHQASCDREVRPVVVRGRGKSSGVWQPPQQAKKGEIAESTA